jgi:phosphatidylglycerol lysyltransferase
MDKLLVWVKARAKILKTIFLLSVIVIVIGESMNISKSINHQVLSNILGNIASWKLIVLLVVGLLSIFPMLGYDIVLNRLLGQKLKKSYLFETSWLINTLNNIAGFGGFVGAGLRSEFYGKGQNGKKVVQSLAKILVFLLAGLSILSLLASAILLLGHSGEYIRKYWLWLVIGGAYFPIIFIASAVGKNKYIGDLSNKNRWTLVGTSFFEWIGVLVTFLATGYALGVHADLYQVIPLFIAASVVGILSMIPGSIGSFDVMIVMGLGTMGVSHEMAVIWLLLYRVFYYLIPVAIGLGFFFKNIGEVVNKSYSGVPKNLALEILHKLEVIALYLSGVMLVLSATIPEAFDQFKWLERFNPFQMNLIMQFPSVLLGFLLIFIGRGMAARVKRVYFPAIVVIFATLLYTFIGGFHLVTVLFIGLLLLSIMASKQELSREQLVYSWEWRTFDGFLVGGLIVLYTTIGVLNAPHRQYFAHHGQTTSFLLFPSERLWLEGWIAIAIVTVLIFALLRYLRGAKVKIGVPLNKEVIQGILNKFGGNSDSQLAFLGDKFMYIYNDGQEDTVFLQLAIVNNKVIVMGNPSGKTSDFPKAIAAFMRETDRYNYLPVFYENTEELIPLLHDWGSDFIKFGEKGHVDLESFTLSGKKMKGQRAAFNKLMKAGYTFEMVDPPFSTEFMDKLQVISTEWLSGQEEKGFSLGFFNRDYLSMAPIAVIKDETDEIIAFTNIMPTYQAGLATIDLMRYNHQTAPSGTMDYLFIHLFLYFQKQGYTAFDLGMTPLANVGTAKQAFTQERIAYLVYTFGSHFYSFEGLREYKEKYATKWQPRYTFYSRGSWLVYVMIAVILVDNQTPNRLKAIKDLLMKRIHVRTNTP